MERWNARFFIVTRYSCRLPCWSKKQYGMFHFCPIVDSVKLCWGRDVEGGVERGMWGKGARPSVAFEVKNLEGSNRNAGKL